MRTAIAHEWVSARAGSEKVFEELAGIFPDADLFALTCTPGVRLQTGGRVIRTTVLDKLGSLRDRRNLLLPLMPLAWRRCGHGEQYDLVISSSHACVKGFAPGRKSAHLCYVHAPMRYVWNPEIDHRGGRGRLAATARKLLRRWDRRSTRWVDSFAANSTAVAERIETFYGRPARVIHPPVDTDFFADAPQVERSGLVSVGRLIPYKGHDLAIRIAAEIGCPIAIIGRGPEERRLRELADGLGAQVTFETGASDEELRLRVAGAQALLFCAEEDFGIVPVEAQAAGTPVVGPRLGGLIDTVIPGQTGELATDLTLDSMVSATRRLLAAPPDTSVCRDNAMRFSAERFRREILDWCESDGVRPGQRA